MSNGLGASEPERSSAIFNNRHMVAVVQAIAASQGSRRGAQRGAQREGFTTRQIAVATGLPDSVVRPVMQRLDAAGVIAVIERRGGARGALHYRTTRSAVWAQLTRLCRSLTSVSADH